MNEKIRIFLADDHKMLRESLIMLLSQEEDFEITGQAALRQPVAPAAAKASRHTVSSFFMEN